MKSLISHLCLQFSKQLHIYYLPCASQQPYLMDGEKEAEKRAMFALLYDRLSISTKSSWFTYSGKQPSLNEKNTPLLHIYWWGERHHVVGNLPKTLPTGSSQSGSEAKSSDLILWGFCCSTRERHTLPLQPMTPSFLFVLPLSLPKRCQLSG